MGSTVVTDVRFAALLGENGHQPIYFLFEEVYEKNCYPHTPRWSCRDIGPLEQMMRRIFTDASACEGGMLQSRRGWMAPERFIQRAMKAFTKPTQMPALTFHWRVGPLLYDTFQAKNLDAVLRALESCGRGDLVTLLRDQGAAEVALPQDLGAILALVETGIPAWSLTNRCSPSSWWQEVPELGYCPPPYSKGRLFFGGMKIKESTPTIRRFGKSFGMPSYVVWSDPEQVWRLAGGSCDIIGEFVRLYWQHEFDSPGSYKTFLTHFRHAVNTAPTLPQGVVAHVIPAAAPDEYRRREVDEFVVQHDARLQPLQHSALGPGYELIVDGDELANEIAMLPRECVALIEPPQTPALCMAA